MVLVRLYHSGEEAAIACGRLIQESFGLTASLPIEEDFA
jgi:hypothetical protein